MPKQDLLLAISLLNGFLEDKGGGKLRSHYLTKGEPEEKAARLALCSLLRSKGPLDRELRTHLANLFDPDPVQWEPRKIELVFRRRGRYPDPVRATQIATRVNDLTRGGEKTGVAIEKAAQEFSLDGEAVKKIWQSYRQRMLSRRGE
jgi:hypothetical protein